MNRPQRQTPLQQAAVAETEAAFDTLSLREIAGATMVRVHSLCERDDLARGFSGRGMTLPLKVNGSAGLDPAALCLRPREWLLYSEYLTPARLLEKAGPALEDPGTAVLDLSDSMAVLRLSGAPAPWLLSKLGSLDFLAAGDAGQHCARALLGRVPVIVHHHPTANEPGAYVFDLLVDRGLASYLWQLLSASAPHALELAERYGGKVSG